MQQHDENRPEDLDTEGEDHAVDDIRYACMCRPFGARVEHDEDLNPLLDQQRVSSSTNYNNGCIPRDQAATVGATKEAPDGRDEDASTAECLRATADAQGVQADPDFRLLPKTSPSCRATTRQLPEHGTGRHETAGIKLRALSPRRANLHQSRAGRARRRFNQPRQVRISRSLQTYPVQCRWRPKLGIYDTIVAAPVSRTSRRIPTALPDIPRRKRKSGADGRDLLHQGRGTASRRRHPQPRGRRPQQARRRCASDPYDVDTSFWEKALADAERAEKDWRARGREIVQIYRGDIPITRPKTGKISGSP